MTINDLIKKLKIETDRRVYEKKESNFSFGIIEEWHKDMIRSYPEQNDVLLDKYYYMILGAIHGLAAAYFITNKEKDELIEDLHWTRYYGPRNVYE